MNTPRCPRCHGPLTDDSGPGPAPCRTCGRGATLTAQPARLVVGAEVIDWLGEQPITRYFMALEPLPTREPNGVYLQALRRSRQRGLVS